MCGFRDAGGTVGRIVLRWASYETDVKRAPLVLGGAGEGAIGHRLGKDVKYLDFRLAPI